MRSAGASSVVRPLEIVSSRQLWRDSLFVCVASSGWVRVAAGRLPAAVVVDGQTGTDTVREWWGRGIPVVAVAMAGLKPTVPDLLAAGARAVVLETTPASELLAALEAITTGERYLARDVSEQGEWRADSLAGLSAREREVFARLIEGKRTKEIAAELTLSPKTVDTYRATMMAKLGIGDVAGLVRYAVRHRLIEEV